MEKVLETAGAKLRARHRLPSLRTLLIALATAVVVPIFLFSAWLIVLQAQHEMDGLEDQLLNTAQAIAIDVDRQVIVTAQSLQTLALDFRPGSVTAREFEEILNRMLSVRRAWRTVILWDPSGKPLIAVSKHAGESLATQPLSDETLKIFNDNKRRPPDSPLAFLLGSSVGVHVPMRAGQKIKYVASAFLDPKIFAALLSQHKVSPDWLVSILDPKKIVVASTRSADRLFGKPAQLLRGNLGHLAPGHLFRSKIQDVPSYVALSTAPVSGWTVALEVPASVVEAPYDRVLWLIVGIALLCLVVGVTLAYLIGRKVARPLERLAAEAKDRAQGNPVETSAEGSLAEVEKIHEAFDQSAHLIKEREQERDYFSEELDVRLHDLTGLHQLTTSLLAIEERHALFNEIVAGALILLKADKGGLHLVNPEMQRIGFVAQVGLAADLPESFHAPAHRAMATRRPIIIENLEEASSFNGQQREGSVDAAVRAALSFPLTERGGAMVGAISTFFSKPFKPSQWQTILMDLYAQYCVNVIQQMKAKEVLRNHNNGLEERVKDHAKKLEEAYLQRIQDLTKQKELEKELREAQKMEIVGTLAGGVAHDFNNILNIILSYASALDTHNEKKSAEQVQVIKDTVKRGAAVVKQLLAVARKTETKFEPTDLNRLVQKLMELLTRTLPRNIIIAGEFDPKIPRVMMDSNQISQALINLCVNARDAMPNGGKLTVRTEYLDAAAVRERFASAKAIPHGCVAVSDTGSGIQNEAKEHIFEPFFTTKAPGHGTGLGLSVAYGIMRAHDGFIHFDSQPDRGTSFYLCFPIREATEGVGPKSEPAEVHQPFSPQGETILIVEDEPNQVILLQNVFAKQGYRVLTAQDGETALEVFGANRDSIAAVVLDFGLPGINGWDVFRKMREIDPQVKVVFSTGYILPEVDMKKIENESCGVVMKPYDPNALRKTVAAAVKEKSASTGGSP